MNSEDYWQIARPLSGVLVASIVFGVSVSAITDFGTIAVAAWCTAIAFLIGVYSLDDVRDQLHDKFVKEPANEDQSEDAQSNEKELREFVYLDSLTVQSLLASLNIPIPQETTELNQQTERVQHRVGLNAGVSAQSVGEVGGNVDISKTDAGTDLVETSKKINDQYIFDRLYDELESRENITTLPDGWDNSPDMCNLNSNGIDIVNFSGKGKTDPVYRMANVLSLVSRTEVLQEYADQDEDMDISEMIEDLQKVVFGNQIGVEFDVADDVAYVASINEGDFWVDDPRREFAASREYTVLGRVVGQIPEDDEWDYIDIFRIGATVLDSDSMGTIRGVVADFIDIVDNYSKSVPLPDLENATSEDIEGEEELPQEDSPIRISVENKKIYVEGPGLIIDPIAIYW